MEQQPKQIVLENGKPPQLIGGPWSIGEVLAAADFLRRWIESQQIATQKPETAKDER